MHDVFIGDFSFLIQELQVFSMRLTQLAKWVSQVWLFDYVMYTCTLSAAYVRK